MVADGFIQTIRELWWDVRPHHSFGTVEVRICDLSPDLASVLGLTALIQCLVQSLSEDIDRGTYQFDSHPMLVRQNKWRACRYGLEARLVDPYTQALRPARAVAASLADRLGGVAESLGCVHYLDQARAMVEQLTGSQRQLEAYRETGDLAEVVRRFVDQQSV